MKQEANFLSKLSDAWLIAVLCVVVPGMFSTGFYLGTQQTDKETVEMRVENREMKDSLVVFRSTTSQQANTANTAKMAVQRQ